ncbi:MAG: hypothetical protein E6J83_15795 [Deltaproteobacteria bacterium]|nr:MAG: hypothetical protein E6J83_15795 [Deltaproteobacteria bacterium]
MSRFGTSTGGDDVRPSVVGVSPTDGATGVSPLTLVLVRLDEPLDPVSANVSTFRLLLDFYQAVPADVALTDGDTTVMITPAVPLFAGRNYAVRVSGARDVARNPLPSIDTFFTTAVSAGSGTLPSSAEVVVNPPSVFANGEIPTTVAVQNILIGGTLAPNGTVIGVTGESAFVGSAGCTISGNSSGVSIDGRFLLFQTLGAKINFFCTPADLTGMEANSPATTTVQIAAVDSDTRPVTMIASGNVTLLGVGNSTVTADPASVPADGTSTSTLSVSVRDGDGNPVPDGTPIGLTAAPLYARTSAGGSIIDGTTSAADGRVRLFTTLGGGFVATYRAPGARGSGAAVIQVLTIDAQGRPTSIAGATTVDLS